MFKPQALLLPLLLAATAAAQAPQVAISIAVRETGLAGQPFTFIGDNGGNAGGIEWINIDGQTLTLDGTWQLFQFDLANDPILGFAGASANGILEGGYGTLENIRVLNTGGHLGQIDLWIDDVSNTITPTGGSPVTTTFGTFDPYADNDEVMFQEPPFSGSTSTNIIAGGTSGVDNYVASRSAACKCRFQFVDALPTRWVRLTTFNSTFQRNPFVRFDQSSVISFWLRGGVGQNNLGSQGPGPAIAEFVGEGLNVGQQSAYVVANTQPSAPGAFLVSLANTPDLPYLGGNLVSFTGFLFSAAIQTNPNGSLSLNFPGMATPVDVVIQCGFFDFQQAQLVTFTNAVLAQFGR